MLKKKNKMPELIFDDNFQPNNKRKFKILFLIFKIIIFISILILVYYSYNIYSYKVLKNRNQIFNDANTFCLNLYENEIIKSDTEIAEIETCLNKIDNIHYDKEKLQNLKINTLEAKEYIILSNEINKYYNNEIVISNVTKDNINNLLKNSENLTENYKNLSLKRINFINSEYEYMQKTIESVNKLFTSNERATVRNDVARIDYNDSKVLVNNLKQDDLKNELSTSLSKVITFIEERERQQKIIEQQKINNAWIKLNVPYVSQNKAGVYNGCEAASLLMGLKYKGYLKNMDIVTFAEQMPKSDNPNTGFYLSIFNKEPNNIAHWIAPKPLAEYGIAASGNQNIINSTGWNIEQLDKEIVNGNPVIIYLTYKFKNPYNWKNGVPNNLHVLLLTGYNKITEQHIVTDPWTAWNGNYKYTLTKKQITNIYNAVGKKSVVIR